MRCDPVILLFREGRVGKTAYRKEHYRAPRGVPRDPPNRGSPSRKRKTGPAGLMWPAGPVSSFSLEPLNSGTLKPPLIRIHVNSPGGWIVVVHPRRRWRGRRRYNVHGGRSGHGASNDGPRDQPACNPHKAPTGASATGSTVMRPVMMMPAPGIADGRHRGDHEDRDNEDDQDSSFHNPSTYRDSVMLCSIFV